MGFLGLQGVSRCPARRRLLLTLELDREKRKGVPFRRAEILAPVDAKPEHPVVEFRVKRQ